MSIIKQIFNKNAILNYFRDFLICLQLYLFVAEDDNIKYAYIEVFIFKMVVLEIFKLEIFVLIVLVLLNIKKYI